MCVFGLPEPCGRLEFKANNDELRSIAEGDPLQTTEELPSWFDVTITYDTDDCEEISFQQEVRSVLLA